MSLQKEKKEAPMWYARYKDSEEFLGRIQAKGILEKYCKFLPWK